MMKTQNVVCEAKLEPSFIDTASEQIRNYLSAQKVERKDIARYTISVEEILLKTLEFSDARDTDVRLEIGTKFFRPFIQLSIAGSPKNIYFNKDELHSVLSDGNSEEHRRFS